MALRDRLTGIRDWQTANQLMPSTSFIFLIILIHQLAASFAFPIAKLGLNQFDPFSYAFFRFIICSALYIILLLIKRQKEKIVFKDRIKIFMLGLFLIPMNQLLFLIGQAKTTASHGSLLFATTPIVIYVMAILFLGEKLTFRRSLGILIAIIGVYTILTGGKLQFGTEHLVGDLIVLAAVIAWGAGTVLGKPLAQKYGALRTTGLALIFGSAVYFPFGFIKALQADYSAVTWVGWFSILYMGIIMSTVAYFIWYWVLKYFEASRIAVVQNIQPIIASATAALVLSEPISRNFIMGGIIVMAGVLLTEIK